MLILEDDVELCNDFVKRFNLCMDELPENWNMFYLNGTSNYNHRDFSDLLYKVKRISGAFGYVVNSNFYDKLIKLLCEEQKPCDGYYLDAHANANIFLSKQKLVKHKDGFSVRTEKNVAYPHLR